MHEKKSLPYFKLVLQAKLLDADEEELQTHQKEGSKYQTFLHIG